ncbi:hypothetical protein ACO3TA_07880 [Methanocaldococcus sp. 28A]
MIKIHPITRYDSENKTLFPISIGLDKSGLEFAYGEGYFYGDEEYDDKNTLFGALTNRFGDKLNTFLTLASITRIAI